MPNYLAENDWKTELKKKENKDIKKTGLSEALRDYEKALKKSPEETIKALGELIKVAKSVKDNHVNHKSLCDYLDEMVKLATSEKSKWVPKDPPKAKEGPDDSKDELAQRLTLAKSITDPEKGLNFVCALGRTTGLFVSRNPITNTHVLQVKAQRGKGKGGPVLRGLAYGDSGKLVFDFGEEAPPKGSAKALRKAVKGVELAYKVIVKGAGTSIEDEQDVDADFESPFEQATGLTDFKAPNRDVPEQGFNYLPKEEWKRLIDEMKKLDPAKREGALSAILGIAKRDGEQLKTDQTVSAELKKARAKIIQDAVTEAKQLASVQQPAAQKPAAPQTANLSQRRGEIHELMAKNVELADKAVFVKGSAAAIGKRPELGIGGQLEPVRLALEACEGGRDAQKFKAVRDACDTFDAHYAKLQGLTQEGFPQGSAQNALNRNDLDLGSNFKACAKLMAACEADPSPKNQEALRKACEIYLKGLAKDRSKATGTKAAQIDEKAKIIQDWHDRAFAHLNEGALKEQAKVSLQARTQVRLAEIANTYKALGDPANWTREQEEVAAELEAAYLFEEGTVTSGASFGAVPLGGTEGGVNAAFWIKRKDPARRGANDGTERLYIFKPSDAEEDVASGLPSGSGAAREVFAKDLSDFLSGSGLKVDVCPTNLVRIDPGKLPNAQGKTQTGPPRVGAMQRLGGDIKGGIVENLRKDNKLAQRIDKKEYDQLAVYDLIIGNLDRHGGNILLSGDLNTAPHLVPIDHGTSMPGPETLKLNRHRILHPQNIMMSPDMAQSDQPLSPEAKQALRNIKAADMTKALRDAQGRLKQRHPELNDPGMGLDDAQLKLMERSTLFMQAAADKLTVREMFEIKSKYVDELMADPEPKWDELVDTLQQRLGRWRTEVASVGKLVPTDAAPGQFPIGALQDLGWCMGMSPDHAKQWVIDNAERANKILAGLIPNPRLQDEVNALRKDLGGAPSVESDTGKLTLLKQMKALQELLVKSNSTDDIRDLQQLAREYQQLGGDKTMRELLAFCSADKQKVKQNEEAVEQAQDAQQRTFAEEDLLRGRVERLRTWKLFVAAGGIAEFARLGGVQTATARDAYMELTSLKAQQQANGDVDKISTEDVSKRQADLIRLAAKEVQTEIDKFRAPKTKQALQLRLDDLLESLKKGDPNTAQGGLKQLKAEAVNMLGSEAVSLKLHRDEVKAMQSQILKAAPKPIAKDLVDSVDKLDKLGDGEVIDAKDLVKARVVLAAKIEYALDPANSKFGKLQQRVNAAGQLITTFQGKAFQRALTDRHAEFVKGLNDFEVGDMFANDIAALERACDYAKRTEAARIKLGTMQGHADETPLRNRIGEIDQLLNGLTVQNFNATVAKINEPLQAAERIVRNA